MHFRLKNYQQIIFYAISFAVVLVLMKWLEIRYVVFQNSFEIYASSIAIIFTALGIWLALKLARPKVETQVIEKEIYLHKADGFVFSQKAADQLGLSNREVEVLQLMALGLSNQEIGDRLFVSLNTVKTHVSRIFDKMEVKRRTQAITIAKDLSIIS